ncbi:MULTISPECIES: hypothetical protein [Cupriavidus]
MTPNPATAPDVQPASPTNLAAPADPPPFLLVRVQSGVHGATVDANGLRLRYAPESEFGEYRNTLHWAVNATVGDHAYGRFNENADGTIKGKIVILADPRELPTPAGLGQVDTWFRMDATRGADGTLERGLQVGRSAILVAPEGEPVPDGVRVARYRGGVEARNAVVNALLREQGITPEIAGMWGWAGSDTTAWAKQASAAQYAGQDAHIHVGAHDSSPDNRIEEGIRVADMVKRFETERLHEGPGGVELPMIDSIRARINAQRTTLQTVLGSLPPTEVERVGVFYAGHLDALDRLEARAERIAREWDAKLAASVEDTPPTPAFTPPPAALQATPPPMPLTVGGSRAPQPFPLPFPSPSPALHAMLPPLPTPTHMAQPNANLARDRAGISLPNPSPTTMPLESTQPPASLVEMDELLIALERAGEPTTARTAESYKAMLADIALDGAKLRADAVYDAVLAAKKGPLPEGAYPNLATFERDYEPMGDIGVAAMEFAGMGTRYPTHHRSLRQLLVCITEGARDAARLDPERNHLALRYTDASLAKHFIVQATQGNDKQLDKIRGPWAAKLIDQCAPGGELSRYPHLLAERMQQFADLSKGYRVTRTASVRHTLQSDHAATLSMT